MILKLVKLNSITYDQVHSTYFDLTDLTPRVLDSQNNYLPTQNF